MSRLAQLQRIFREVFDDDTLRITPETSHGDIEGWDSLAQIKIVSVVESQFDVRLADEEVVGIRSVGDLLAAVERQAGRSP